MNNEQKSKSEQGDPANEWMKDLAWASGKLKAVAPVLALWMIVQYCFSERIVFPVESIGQLASSLVVLLLLALMLSFYLGYGLLFTAWVRHPLTHMSRSRDGTQSKTEIPRFSWKELILDVFAAMIASFFVFYICLVTELSFWQILPYLLGCMGAGFLLVLVLLVPSSHGRRIMFMVTSFALAVLLLVVVNVQQPATNLALQVLGIRSAPSDIVIFSNSAKSILTDLQNPENPLKFCQIGESKEENREDAMWTFSASQLLWGSGELSTVRVLPALPEGFASMGEEEQNKIEANRAKAAVQIALPADDVKILRNNTLALLEQAPSRCSTQ